MMENGIVVRLLDREPTFTKVVKSTLVHELTTSSMGYIKIN